MDHYCVTICYLFYKIKNTKKKDTADGTTLPFFGGDVISKKNK
jgi:hypothetical protein